MADMRRAFSLVELSIVLVLIGLLVGGILTGRHLVRASQVRSVMADVDRYAIATRAFEEQYNTLPGDFSNATMLWGKNATHCNSAPGGANTNGTCNGNGDGIINNTSTAYNNTSEAMQFWKHLSLAGLIDGAYSGISGASPNANIIGANVPATTLKNVTIAVAAIDYQGSTGTWLNGTGTNSVWGSGVIKSERMLMVGSPGSGNFWPGNSFLTPAQAQNLDDKMDDGNPITGKIKSMGCRTYGNQCLIDSSGAFAGTNCNTFAAASPTYNVGESAQVCSLLFTIR